MRHPPPVPSSLPGAACVLLEGLYILIRPRVLCRSTENVPVQTDSQVETGAGSGAAVTDPIDYAEKAGAYLLKVEDDGSWEAAVGKDIDTGLTAMASEKTKEALDFLMRAKEEGWCVKPDNASAVKSVKAMQLKMADSGRRYYAPYAEACVVEPLPFADGTVIPIVAAAAVVDEPAAVQGP